MCVDTRHMEDKSQEGKKQSLRSLCLYYKFVFIKPLLNFALKQKSEQGTSPFSSSEEGQRLTK